MHRDRALKDLEITDQMWAAIRATYYEEKVEILAHYHIWVSPETEEDAVDELLAQHIRHRTIPYGEVEAHFATL